MKITHPAPWPAIAIMVSLLLTAAALNAWADRVGPSWPATAPATTSAKTEQNSASPQASAPSPKYHYKAREEVTGAYIFTAGTLTALTAGWATMPAGEHRPAWYAYGPATDQLTIESTSTVTKIVWILPDGSQRIQQGDLTYYNPETGINE